jgi:hypothetical protein
MLRLILAGLMLCVCLVRPSFGAECEGNACGSVSVVWNGHCYNVTNNSAQSIAIEFNTGWIKIGKVVGPQQSWIPGIAPGCMGSYMHPYTANFK